MNWQSTVELLAPFVGPQAARQIATYALPRLPSGMQQDILREWQQRQRMYVLCLVKNLNLLRMTSGMVGPTYDL
jgi:hypothetical protein